MTLVNYNIHFQALYYNPQVVLPGIFEVWVLIHASFRKVQKESRSGIESLFM